MSRPNSVEYGNFKTTILLPSAKCTRPLFQGRTGCGGRPSGWHDIVTCQHLVYLFFLWPPYSPALVNGGSRNFYTWWTLSVIEEVTTWIFSWSSLNYRVGQKVTKFGIFSDPPANFLLSRPNAAEYCNSEKNLLSTDGFSTMYATFGELWPTNP